MSRFIIAGTHSGVGKTTITSAITKALKKRNYDVQPFKVGPDYIDSGYHTKASGRDTRNLDGWMLTGEQVVEVLARNTPETGFSIIEGVMGLFDGYSAQTLEGSTAHIAMLTNTPVVLIVDGSKMARSAAAVVLGYKMLEEDVKIGGIIFNKLGGHRHYKILKQAVSQLNIPVLGYFPREGDDTQLPERHLGLVPTSEMTDLEVFLDYWGERAERYLDIDKIIQLFSRSTPLQMPQNLTLPQRFSPPQCNIAVVKDEAFTFYYPENLELLGARGANIVEISLLEDKALPRDCHGLYIGGGFPEVFASKLSENTSMLKSIKNAAESGMPVYGECGGFLYLTRGINDFEGEFYPLAAIFDCTAVMRSKRQALGYTLAQTLLDNFLTIKGEETKGHEFHWSEISFDAAYDFVYTFTNKEHKEDGLLYKNVLGSYVHLHFYSNPAVAERFVKACNDFRKKTAF